jgi:hypothetical protein
LLLAVVALVTLGLLAAGSAGGAPAGAAQARLRPPPMLSPPFGLPGSQFAVTVPCRGLATVAVTTGETPPRLVGSGARGSGGGDAVTFGFAVPQVPLGSRLRVVAACASYGGYNGSQGYDGAGGYDGYDGYNCGSYNRDAAGYDGYDASCEAFAPAFFLVGAAPGAPTNLVVVPRDGAVEMIFDPAPDNGFPILRYDASCVSGGALVVGAPPLITGLANESPYLCTVTAQNQLGFGAPSEEAGPVTPSASIRVDLVYPPDGAVIGGGSYFGAGAFPGVQSLTFLVNGFTLGTAVPTPYGWWLLTRTRFPEGQYRISARALDHPPLGVLSDGITITIDHTAPATSVIVPARNGTVLTGTAMLEAAATDAHGVKRVEFRLSGNGANGNLIATSTQTAYGWIATWDSTSVPNGDYTISSTAIDSGGNRQTSGPRSVTIRN